MKKAVEKLNSLLEQLSIEHMEEAKARFVCYGEALLAWNQKINLTAITDPEEIVMKHFYDSLTFLQYINMKQNAALIDVGTGAGFPGIPLLIVRPDLKVTLLDSTKKRLLFLEDVLQKTGLSAQTLHARGEEAGRLVDYREQYDFATARAVAAMPVLAEYCLPFVKRGGQFIAMKGPDFEKECSEAAKALALLGGEVKEVKKFTLPDDSRRTMVVVEKMSQTPSKYPRTSAKIAKKPL